MLTHQETRRGAMFVSCSHIIGGSGPMILTLPVPIERLQMFKVCVWVGVWVWLWVCEWVLAQAQDL